MKLKKMTAAAAAGAEPRNTRRESFVIFFSDFVLSAGLLDLLFFSDISTAAMPTLLAGPASLLPTINF